MKIGDKTGWSVWCNECRKNDIMEIVSIKKNKEGCYQPYRDTMESEPYYYTELKVKCLHCGTETKTETDEHYIMSETDMQKYGYRGANYGT